MTFHVDLPDFLKTYLSSIWGWLILLSLLGGVYLAACGYVGKFHFGFLSLPIQARPKTKRNNVMKFGGIVFALGIGGFIFFHPKADNVEIKLKTTYNSSNIYLGKWLIMPTEFNTNKGGYVLVFENYGSSITGKIYRDDGEKYGVLTKIKVNQTLITRTTGKIGMYDGRKFDFKGEVQPDSTTLIIEYAERETKRFLGTFEAKKIE